MFYYPDKYKTCITKVNEELSLLQGTIPEDKAKITLAQFLYANVGLTVDLMTGIKLYPMQEVLLKGFLKRNFSMMIASRGAGKSFLAAVYAFLECVFNPGTNIIIAGPTFRTSRFIFNKLDEIVSKPEAVLLSQCLGIKTKRNDVFDWEINGGSIKAIPLNGEKIRGFRCRVLLIDEANWLDETIIKSVLMPFLVSPQNLRERIKVRELEDALIKKGLLDPENRVEFENDSKMIYLSSAGYTFEYLYKLYQEWIANMQDEKKEAEAKYFIAQVGYESLPPDMVDSAVIEEAKAGGMANAIFKMEYGAQFNDGSDAYFSAKKMEECTLKNGEYPHTKIVGDKNKKYVLGIDCNLSDSPSADYFAIAVMELDEEAKVGTLVHGYQGLGDLSNHVKYLAYLFTNFNIVLVYGDNAGLDTVMSACNNSQEFKLAGINVKELPFDSEAADGEERFKMLAAARNLYNQESRRYLISQFFTTGFIRKANEHLQSCIEFKKVWFASKTSAHDSYFNNVNSQSIPTELIFNGPRKDWSKLDFIEHQDFIIADTKKQCALVELQTTSRGTQSFDLPHFMRRNESPNKPRKDNYSALLLANWGVKSYFEITETPAKVVVDTLVPTLL